MVAEPASQATIVPFPQQSGSEARVRRLIAAIASLSVVEGVPTGIWRGTQQQIADRMGESLPTVERAVQDARRTPYLTVKGGRGGALTYILPAVPEALPAPAPRPISSLTSLTSLSNIPQDVRDVPGKHPSAESGPRARAVPLSSSSSSSDIPHPGSGSQRRSDRTGGGGGEDGGSRLVASPVMEILARFGVEADEDLAARWATFSTAQHDEAIGRAAAWPARKRALHPSPEWLRAIFDSVEALTLELPEGVLLETPAAVEPSPRAWMRPTVRRETWASRELSAMRGEYGGR